MDIESATLKLREVLKNTPGFFTTGIGVNDTIIVYTTKVKGNTYPETFEGFSVEVVRTSKPFTGPAYD